MASVLNISGKVGARAETQYSDLDIDTVQCPGGHSAKYSMGSLAAHSVQGTMCEWSGFECTRDDLSNVYKAGWNMPGCLPETEPVVFIGWDLAQAHVLDELNRWADQEDCEKDDSVPTETFMQAINAIRDLLDYDSGNWSSTPVMGYVFWIEHA